MRKLQEIIIIGIILNIIIGGYINTSNAVNSSNQSSTNKTTSTTSSNTTKSNTTSSNTASKSTTTTSASSKIIKNIEVEGYQISPQFSNTVYEYTLEIDGNVSSLNIVTEKEEGATVEIAGNNNLVVGENIITILAYSSNKKNVATYQIIVNKKESEETSEEENVEQNDTIKKAKIVRYTLISGISIITLMLIIGIVMTRDKKLYKSVIKN